MDDKDPGDVIATDSVEKDDRKNLIVRKVWKLNIKDILTWELVKTVAMSQCLASLICGTAVTSQYLASDYHVDTPMLQSFMSYALLCLTYTTALLFRTGDGNIFQILKKRWWKYFLLGLVDVEANYTVVKAYQYTTLTSIQLLDCFVIPVVMILSWWFLKTCYRPIHYISVFICLLGVGAMVGADLLAGRDQGSTSDILLGDGLVLLSASLYAVSNVCQEYTVKHLSRVEFLGMIGLFGTLISGIQLGIVEHRNMANIQWDWRIALLFAAYGLCMYTLYSCMPIVVKKTSATAVNLSLLTADLFSLFCGLFLFHYTFSGLYIVSLVVILIGFIAFNTVATTSKPANPSGREENVHDNPDDTISKQEVVVTVQEEVKNEHTEGEGPGLTWRDRTKNEEIPAEGRSTKM
ncbi:hypothetical protein DPEC_G00247350 [Dallia pectoralis]|uniref:Uncharacterized protein n=1 Tax=Dallia pectoralis TaxID=75939 RepID=A0ACC2FWP8_DALPE|nr:hypothetical protein DPEC_G00247350 [Dallia pectoralis]